jgi:hypothetical protein
MLLFGHVMLLMMSWPSYDVMAGMMMSWLVLAIMLVYDIYVSFIKRR